MYFDSRKPNSSYVGYSNLNLDLLHREFVWAWLCWLSPRKHPFIFALRWWPKICPESSEALIGPRETSPAAKSEEKRIISQAIVDSALDLFVFWNLECLWNTRSSSFRLWTATICKSLAVFKDQVMISPFIVNILPKTWNCIIFKRLRKKV